MIRIILSVVIVITAPLMGAGSFVCVGPFPRRQALRTSDGVGTQREMPFSGLL